MHLVFFDHAELKVAIEGRADDRLPIAHVSTIARGRLGGVDSHQDAREV
jgi:hypothetical protein